MSDEQPVIDGDPNLATADDAEIVAEVEELVKPENEKDRDKVKSALIQAKRDLKAARRQVKDLEPVAARAREIDDRLNRAQPIIDAVINNPKLRAEALRIGNKIAPTAEHVEQPTTDEDPDAGEFAEINGYYMADGVTPDVVRARRTLTILDRRSGRQTDERIRPLAGLTLNQKANENLRDAAAMTDADGTPFATRESIDEVAKQLPPHLLANPQVLDLVINSAIGLDKRKGRTPKPLDEPLYLERQTGRRAPKSTTTAQEKAQLERMGLTEADYNKAGDRLEQAVATRRSIVLGS